MTRLWITWYRLRCWAVEEATTRVRARQMTHDDRGAGFLEAVVYTALCVAAAIIVVGIIVAKAKSTAENIQTQ